MTEGKVDELENISIKFILSGEHRERQLKKWRELQTYGTISKCPTFMSLDSQKKKRKRMVQNKYLKKSCLKTSHTFLKT